MYNESLTPENYESFSKIPRTNIHLLEYDQRMQQQNNVQNNKDEDTGMNKL